jgi:hypothetical protein
LEEVSQGNGLKKELLFTISRRNLQRPSSSKRRRNVRAPVAFLDPRFKSSRPPQIVGAWENATTEPLDVTCDAEQGPMKSFQQPNHLLSIPGRFDEIVLLSTKISRLKMQQILNNFIPIDSS